MAQHPDQRPSLLSELTAFCNEPLAIRASYLETLVSRAVSQAVTPKLEAEALRYVGSHAFAIGQIVDAVAVIPIIGPLAKRSYYNWTYDDIAVSIQQALDDSKVSAILLNVDSPGGAASGMIDLADMIYEARGTKPIHAIANESGYSAAYGVLSAADVVWLPRTAGVGSVGTLAVHVDWSKMNTDMGIKVTPIFAGEKKIDGHPDFPLSQSAYDDTKAEIDRLNEIFLETVARNRGMTVEAVRETEAGTFHGGHAIEVGFADRIGTFDEAMTAIVGEATPQASSLSLVRMASGLSITPEQLHSDLVSAGYTKATRVDETAPTTEAESMANEKEQKTPATEAKTETPAKAEAAAPKPEATAEVIDINAAKDQGRAEAKAEAKARVDAINMHCSLAGPAFALKSGEYIASDMTAEEVGKAILEAKSKGAGEEVDGHTTNGGGSEQALPQINPSSVYAKWNGRGTSVA